LKRFSSFVARDRTDSEVTQTTVVAFEEAFGVCHEYIILDKPCLFSGSYGRLFVTKTSLWIVAGLRNDKKKIIPISSSTWLISVLFAVRRLAAVISAGHSCVLAVGEVEVSHGVSLAPSILIR
jgi:hypothetical protein